MIVSDRTGMSGFWEWWSDLVIPDGSADVVYRDVSELTVKPVEELTPEERARLQRVVDEGAAREARRKNNRAALLTLGALGLAGLGIALAANSLRRSR